MQIAYCPLLKTLFYQVTFGIKSPEIMWKKYSAARIISTANTLPQWQPCQIELATIDINQVLKSTVKNLHRAVNSCSWPFQIESKEDKNKEKEKFRVKTQSKGNWLNKQVKGNWLNKQRSNRSQTPPF